MFVGHGLLAFAVVALAADAAGWSRERALAVGLLAGAFGLAPDVDMLYAPIGVVGASGPMDAATEFWMTGNQVHRAVTHSLIVGCVTAVAAGALATRTRAVRAVGGATLAGLVCVAFVVSGWLGGVVMAAFALAIAGLARIGGRVFAARVVSAAAAVGVLSHPFGDLLTGEPPGFLYPFDATLVATRPVPFADPTLNLLAPLFLELATMWLALAVYCRLDGRRLTEPLAGRAAVGAGFAAAAFVLPAPTLTVSYHFVFPLVGVGLLAAAPSPRLVIDRRRHRDRLLRAAATGLSAVTLAALAYTGAYLAVGL